MDLSYSVIIRTLGNTGEKYRRLIASILSQSIQPEEIIVVLPYGYSLDYQTGKERIVFSKKGMVTQRAVGISECNSEYMLVVDDDVAFDSHMVEDLLSYTFEHKLDCCLPMEGRPCDNQEEYLALGLPRATKYRGAFTGQVFTTHKKSEFIDKVTKTAGHKIYLSSNRLDQCYLSQTGNFQCFFINSTIAKSVHFEDEVWLEEGDITPYASYDDQTYFYKLYLNGGKIGYSLRTRYSHLDASAGRPSKSLLESKIIRYYTVARNRTIFWYKFLWKPCSSFQQKFSVLAGGIYGLNNYMIWSILVSLHPKYWKAISALMIGYKDAFKYIRQIKSIL